MFIVVILFLYSYDATLQLEGLSVTCEVQQREDL